MSMYDSQTALIANYINPIIGDMEVQDITTRVVDKYIQTLQKTPSVSRKNRKARTEFVTNSTIEKIIKLLRCAFKQAVRWELIEKNPFDNVVLPKTEYKKRDIWDAETIRLALDQCTDSKLYIAMNLAFACSLRMGEILGLTWKNVHIEDENIATDNAYIYIEAELARASKQAIETLGEKDIYHIFTPLMPNTSTRIILKKPKTDSSIRKVWLPKTVAYILREWKTSQEELKSFLGDEYQDFDLVVALPNGRPCENRAIFVLNTPCRAISSREVTKEQTANLYHRNFTSAGYSASSVEKYHYPSDCHRRNRGNLLPIPGVLAVLQCRSHGVPDKVAKIIRIKVLVNGLFSCQNTSERADLFVARN